MAAEVLTPEQLEARRAYQREWSARNRDKVAAYAKTRKDKDPERFRAQQQASRERNRTTTNARGQAWRDANREESRRIGLAGYYKHHEKNKARARARARAAYPTTGKNTRLLKKFGVTTEQWEEIFEWQGRCCACCQSTDPQCEKGWTLDHSHPPEEFRIRGILCWLCNVRLGQLGDNAAAVKTACALYLQYLALSGDSTESAAAEPIT